VKNTVVSAQQNSKSSFHRSGKPRETRNSFIDVSLLWLSAPPLPIPVSLNLERDVTPKLLQ
jgi:hypothetical protein